MATIGTKVFLVILMLFVIAGLVTLTYISRNWFGNLPAEREDLTAHTTRDFSQVVRQSDIGKGPVQLLGIAERAVLDRHFAVLGGLDKIASVSSLRFAGRVTFDTGSVQDVIVVKKGGDRMRTTVRSNTSQTTWVLSPEINWRGVWVNGNLREVRVLSDDEVEESLRYIHVVSELYLAQQNGWDMRYLGVKDFNYKMAHVFEVKLEPRHTIEYYIDPKTFLDVGRVDKIFESDGTLTIIKRLHVEHFDANGFTLPGTVQTYLNGELLQEFELNSAQFNAGVLDEIFEWPQPTTKP